MKSLIKKFYYTKIKKRLVDTVHVRGTIGKEDKKLLKENKGSIYFDKQNISELFKSKENIILEIGFGNGGHLLSLSDRNKENNIVGVEMYIVGLAKTLRQATSRSIKNILFVNADTRLVLKKIKQNTLDAVYILFPDPWPKKKHNKRRLLKKDFIENVLCKIKKEGHLVIATDWAEYADEIKQAIKEIQKEKSIREIEISTEDKKEILSTTFAKRAEKEGRGIYIVKLEK